MNPTSRPDTHVRTISNDNRTFTVRNGIEAGSWYSGQLYAMHVAGDDRAELKTYARSDSAKFTKNQLLTIAEALRELAERMPDQTLETRDD